VQGVLAASARYSLFGRGSSIKIGIFSLKISGNSDNFNFSWNPSRIELMIMKLQKPFYRIARPGATMHSDYILDGRYASDRFMLLQSFQLIENDLKRILEFVEPTDSNVSVYSHRIYELFLRCATEFETNCKKILSANGYHSQKSLNIGDYYRINVATNLSEYEVKINIWHPSAQVFKPLGDWAAGSSLGWYQDYNCVKHDRFVNFDKASLNNVLYAAGSLISLLFAQFDEYAFSPYSDETMSTQQDDAGFWYGINSLFNVNPFTAWSVDESYGFDWKSINSSLNPYQQYSFLPHIREGER